MLLPQHGRLAAFLVSALLSNSQFKTSSSLSHIVSPDPSLQASRWWYWRPAWASARAPASGRSPSSRITAHAARRRARPTGVVAAAAPIAPTLRGSAGHRRRAEAWHACDWARAQTAMVYGTVTRGWCAADISLYCTCGAVSRYGPVSTFGPVSSYNPAGSYVLVRTYGPVSKAAMAL